MPVNTGDIKNRKQTTARVWMKRSGGQYTELGDVENYKKADEKGYSDVKGSVKGFKRQLAKLLNNVSLMWMFTLNEELSEVLRLLGLATKQADSVQSTAASQSESFTSVVLGASYFLTKQNVTALTVTVSSVLKVEGTDYTVDLGSGVVTILATGSITAGATAVVAYDAAAQTFENYTSLKETRVNADFRVHEYDQFSEVPREMHDFAGQIWISNQGENSSEKPSTVEVSILVTTNNPTNKKRVDS